VINYTKKAGSVDVSVVVRIIDSTDGTPETGVVFNTAGIDLQYRREGSASVAITEATLAALTTSHTDGGFLHIGNGYYRLDLPDAAVASGAAGVLVHGTVTGMVVIGCYIELVAYDPADTVRLGLTALPNAAAEAAGGLYTRGTGAGQINQPANGMVDANVVRNAGTAITAAAGRQEVNVSHWLGTAAATPTVAGVPEVDITHLNGTTAGVANLKNAFDDTAGPVPWLGIVDQGTAQSATSTTVVLRAAAAFADDTLIGAIVMVFGSTQGYWQARQITDYVGSTDTATVDAWQVTPSGTITYKIIAAPPAPATPPAVNVTQVIGDPIITSSSKTTNWGGT
jgi:hypothetical protein